MKYLFDGDNDALEFIIENGLNGYENIEFHNEPIYIEEFIRDKIENGRYYRVEQTDTIITFDGRSWQLREMIPVVANNTDYHVVGVLDGEDRNDIRYYVVPCEWSPRFGTAGEMT